MNPILIIYATHEGQTRKIAEHIAASLRENSLPADVMDARNVPAGLSIGSYSSAILASSVHGGKHHPELVKFVKAHRTDLEQIPSAFLSVSLSQAGVQDPEATPEQRRKAAADVKMMISAFLSETVWRPTRVAPVAGALMYSKYGFFLRFLMKIIARQAGASTDTSRDHEFTDWGALDEFIHDFVKAELYAETHV